MSEAVSSNPKREPSGAMSNRSMTSSEPSSAVRARYTLLRSQLGSGAWGTEIGGLALDKAFRDGAERGVADRDLVPRRLLELR